jgi:hypothetical protein
MHDAVHEMRAVAAMQATAGYPVIRRSESLVECSHCIADLGGRRGCSLEIGAARIPLLALFQFLDDGIERLFPADANELRVNAETFLRVCPLERVIHPVWIIKKMSSRKTLDADLAPPRWSVRVPLNFGHYAVLPPDPDSAHAVALAATRGDPDILLNFGCICNSHLTVLSLNYKTKVEFVKRSDKAMRQPTCSVYNSRRDYKSAV